MPRTKQATRSSRRKGRKSDAEEQEENAEAVEQESSQVSGDGQQGEQDASLVSEGADSSQDAMNLESSMDQHSADHEQEGDDGEHDAHDDSMDVANASAELMKENDEMGTKRVDEDEAEKGKEEEIITSYKPHTFPSVDCNSLTGKWEWHMQIFPIDQENMRSCVLESVSKIAQETWMYIDKKNYGMGSFDMCLRSVNDASVVMLKLLHAPMSYRYVTIQVTRRGKNKTKLGKLEKAKAAAAAKNDADAENKADEEIEKLPYTEVKETATVLLDYMHTATVDKIKGKEKKRSLFVKYLPEGTSKELLNVLFPVANNLDIITTGSGRRVGNLNVATFHNVSGVCNAYITVNINGCKNIGLDWKEENIDDGVKPPVASETSPWQILQRNTELAYEAVPEEMEDEKVQYRKRKREMEQRLNQKPTRETREIKEKGRKDRKSRWDNDAEKQIIGAEMLKMQLEMNEKIQSQLALLQNVSAAASLPSLMDTPVMPGRSRDKDRGSKPRDQRRRDRRISEGSGHAGDALDRDRSSHGRGRDRSGGRDRGRKFGSPDGDQFGNRRGGFFGGRGRFDDGGRFGDRPGDFRGGRFDYSYPEGHFDHGGGGHFDSYGREGLLDFQGPVGGVDYPGPGGRFDYTGYEQFDDRGRFDRQGRGGRFDNRGPGGYVEGQERGGNFGSQGRRGRFDQRGKNSGMDRKRGRGGQDNQGRRGQYGSQGRDAAGFNTNAGENMGSKGGNFGRGNQQGVVSQADNFGGQQAQNQSGMGNQGLNQQSGFGNQQMNMGGNQSQQTNYNQQQSGFGTQQANYTNDQQFGNQQAAYGNFGNQQGFGGQQQSTYSAGTGTGQSDYWGVPYSATGQTNYSTQGGQDYNAQAYGQQQQATGPDQSATAYGMAAYQTAGNAGTGFSADAAFANQGFYSTDQGTGGAADYGGYGAQGYGATNQQQSNLTTAYNFAQYPSSTS